MVSFRLPKSTQSAGSSNTGSGPHVHASSIDSGAGGTNRLHMSKVRTGRLVFVLCLAGVAAILGVVTFNLLTNAEDTLAQEQFESISDRVLDTSLEIALRQKQGLITLASMAEQTFPDAQTWPFVNFKGFQTIATNLIQTYSSNPSSSVSFLPLVTPLELSEFNAFAAPLFPDAPYDRVTGLDSNLNRYNETDGETDWGSPRRIFTPFLFSSLGQLLFLANLHSLETRGGRDIDNMITCSEERARDMNMNTTSDNNNNAADADSSLVIIPKDCSLITEFTDLSRSDVVVPAAITIQPLYPANNPDVLVGFLTSAIKWEDVLFNVFSNKVSGVDCVVATETQSYTYHITNGQATLKGEGDLHDSEFTAWGRSVNLDEPGLYGDLSAKYTLTLYPSDELFEVYATTNPVVATVGAVCIIIFISALFFLYDFCVRKEFSYRERLALARRQYVRFISHEVRTPLNSVCMGLQLVRDEAQRLTKAHTRDTNDTAEESKPTNEMAPCVSTEQLQSKLTDMLDLSEDIFNSAHSAVDVLNDLLNYDKVESGTMVLELTVLDIWTLIERTTSEFSQQAKAKSIEYVLDFSSLLPVEDDQAKSVTSSASQLPRDIHERKVIGDTSRISQVLRNLVSNAIKFTPERGNLTIRVFWKRPTGTVTTSEFLLHSGKTEEFLDQGSLQVEVTDTGAGLSEGQLKNLFREGIQFNVNELQAGQGSGLGLYIAKGILEQHGGSLSAASEGIGRGTTFTMTIPLHYVPSAAMPKGLEWQLAPTESIVMEPLKLLVVDDSAMNRKLLVRLLQNQGHRCDEAENGLVAVQRVQEAMNTGEPYASILMDNEMPEMNGPTAAKKIRELGCDAFIAGVTGNVFSEDIALFKQCGANVVLAKPLEMSVLVGAWVENGVVGVR